eukprot:scaffold21484_cov123-Isochrysis_galbana.AAC.6
MALDTGAQCAKGHSIESVLWAREERLRRQGRVSGWAHHVPDKRRHLLPPCSPHVDETGIHSASHAPHGVDGPVVPLEEEVDVAGLRSQKRQDRLDQHGGRVG